MAKQKLSPKASAAKKKRDLATAKTPRRTAMKAENQRKRRAAKKNGANLNGKDYDHNRGGFVSVKINRSATKTTNNTMAAPKKKKASAKKMLSKMSTKPGVHKGVGKKGVKAASAKGKKSPMKKLSNSGKPTGMKKMGTKKTTIKGLGRKKK